MYARHVSAGGRGARPVASGVIAVLLAAAVLALCACTGQAKTHATVYVGSSAAGRCSDSRSAAQAKSPARPVCSIARAIALVGPGGTVAVHAGSYPALNLDGSGSRTGYVTVRPVGHADVRIPSIDLGGRTSWLRFRGLDLGGDSRPTFRIEEGQASHLQLVGSSVHSGGADAVSIRSGASDLLFAHNTISSRPPGAHGGGNGISFSSQSALPGVPDPSDPLPPIRHVVIRGNHFTSIGTDAIRPANFDGLVIENNDITGVVENGDHCDAIQVTWGGRHLVVRGNFIHDNQGQGLFIKDGQVTDATVENNVFAHNRRVGIQIQFYDTIGLKLIGNTEWDNDLHVAIRDGVRNAVVRDNIFQGFSLVPERSSELSALRANVNADYDLIGGGVNVPRGPHDLHGRPRFVDAAHEDYRLAKGSPGIDAGTSAGAPARDKVCRARYDEPGMRNRGGGAVPFTDMGALEARPNSRAGDTASRSSGCGGTGKSGSSDHRAALSLLHARARHGRAAVALRPHAGCRLRVSGSVRWRPRGARHARSARFHAVRHAIRPGRAATVRLRLPSAARRALRHHRTLRAHLAFRVSGCGTKPHIVHRSPRLRH